MHGNCENFSKKTLFKKHCPKFYKLVGTKSVMVFRKIRIQAFPTSYSEWILVETMKEALKVLKKA